MIKYLTLLFFILTLNIAFGQTDYEPQILILAPNVTKYDKVFEKEIVEFNREIKKSINISELEQSLNSPEFKKESENIQMIAKNELVFYTNIDFFKQVSLVSEQFLLYRFFEIFPNLLIKLKDAKSNGTLEDLKIQSEKEKLQYVLNFASIELYKENKISYAKVRIQFYDNISNSIPLEKTYIGNWHNPGFEFACDDQSINCTINNALSQALNDVINIVASNSPTLKRERQLRNERFDVLVNTYLNQPFDKSAVNSIIAPKDSSINIDKVYQVLLSADKSKFVAFFLEQTSAHDFKTLKDNKRDNNVNIITSKDIKDEGFLDEMPQNYAYIVKGLKFQDKWYYEKTKVTYFEAKTLIDGQQKFFNNLQQWSFFKENSTEFNPNFWESDLFAKVPDLRKDPEWEEYGNTIWKTEEINNRPYVGLYQIVADKIRKELEFENAEFEKTKVKQFDKFYKELKTKKPDKYNTISEHSLIYPSDKSIFVNPTLITNKEGIKTIHYFVMLANQNNVFEWTYFEPKIVSDNYYGIHVVDQIGSLTDWNFSVVNLNDMEFWNKYVLLKSGDTYKYLTEIK